MNPLDKVLDLIISLVFVWWVYLIGLKVYLM